MHQQSIPKARPITTAPSLRRHRRPGACIQAARHATSRERHAHLRAQQQCWRYRCTLTACAIAGHHHSASGTAALQGQRQEQEADDDQRLGPVVVAAASGAGSAWCIRPYDEKTDFWPVAELQARCFHDKLPFAPLDTLAFTMFKAEVVDGLKSKAKCVDAATYAMLVVQEAAPPASPAAASTPEASPSVSSPNGTSASAGRNGGSSADGGSGQQQHPSGAVVGIVELGLQEEGENVRALQKAGVAGKGAKSSCVYLSSMAVAPTARRSGAARAMLRAAQWQAALWGQRHIALHVYADNIPALKLYSSSGWEAVGKDPDWRKFVGGKVRAFMVKRAPDCIELEGEADVPAAVAQQLRQARELWERRAQQHAGQQHAGQQQHTGQQQQHEQQQHKQGSGAAEQAAPAA